jgi:hypothetical protein
VIDFDDRFAAVPMGTAVLGGLRVAGAGLGQDLSLSILTAVVVG